MHEQENTYKLFEIQEKLKDRDENSNWITKNISFLVNLIFNRVERICILLHHDVFDEIEAASYLRLNDPENTGRSTVRNYALRSKKLPFVRIGRDGLIFQRKDLNEFLKSNRVETYFNL